jgi:hypothetical protein
MQLRQPAHQLLYSWPKPRADPLLAAAGLTQRKKPYCVKIAPGIHLGCRRNAGPGTWSVRAADGGTEWLKKDRLAADVEPAVEDDGGPLTVAEGAAPQRKPRRTGAAPVTPVARAGMGRLDCWQAGGACSTPSRQNDSATRAPAAGKLTPAYRQCP